MISVRIFIKIVGVCQRLAYMALRLFTGRKYIVIGARQVGIGNRLMMMANTYCNYGRERISLIWGIDEWVPERFENLFQMSDAPGFRIRSCVISQFSHTLFTPYPAGHSAVAWRLYASTEESISLDGKTLFCLYNETPQWAKEKYGCFFRQLKPSEAVAKRIAECPLPADVICVQARNSHGKYDFANVASLDNLIACMHGLSKKGSQKFFISCMERDVSARLHAEFENQIIELPNKDPRSMIDAVADLYLLGSGHTLICTKGSTFSEVAWWIGLPKKVIALASDYRQH